MSEGTRSNMALVGGEYEITMRAEMGCLEGSAQCSSYGISFKWSLLPHHGVPYDRYG